MSINTKLIYEDSFRKDQNLEKLLQSLTITPKPHVKPSSDTKSSDKKSPQNDSSPWILTIDDESFPLHPPAATEPLQKGKSKPRLSSDSTQYDDPAMNFYIANVELKSKTYVY